MGKATVLLLLFSLQFINGSVLLWSSTSLQIPTLKVFDDADLKKLLQSLNEPHLIAIEINSDSIPTNLENLIKDKSSAYIPSAKLNISDKIVLTQDEEVDFELIENTIKEKEETYGSKNILGLLIINYTNKRLRREVESSDPESSSASPAEEVTQKSVAFQAETPSGPQLYSAEGKSMLYSSNPLIFMSNDSADIILGKSSYVSVDHRETYSRLSVTIPVDKNKVILLFRFTWLSGYWSLTSVEVEVFDIGTKYQLVSIEDMTAPRDFSYHCGGMTTFTDGTNVLQIFDIQVQPEVSEGRFSDAYDCVPFTTVPIWSGLLVTSILGLGLLVGLTALGSIKTMDKFDNYKTKQLTITVSE